MFFVITITIIAAILSFYSGWLVGTRQLSETIKFVLPALITAVIGAITIATNSYISHQQQETIQQTTIEKEWKENLRNFTVDYIHDASQYHIVEDDMIKVDSYLTDSIITDSLRSALKVKYQNDYLSNRNRLDNMMKNYYNIGICTNKKDTTHTKFYKIANRIIVAMLEDANNGEEVDSLTFEMTDMFSSLKYAD